MNTTLATKPRGRLLRAKEAAEEAKVTTNAWYLAAKSTRNPRPAPWIDPATGIKYWRLQDVRAWAEAASTARQANRKVSPAVLAEMKRLRKSGLKQTEIAAQLELSVRVVNQYLSGKVTVPGK